VGFNGRKQLWTGAHERNSTPVREGRFKGEVMNQG
jgi:hypothetical protein